MIFCKHFDVFYQHQNIEKKKIHVAFILPEIQSILNLGNRSIKLNVYNYCKKR